MKHVGMESQIVAPGAGFLSHGSIICHSFTISLERPHNAALSRLATDNISCQDRGKKIQLQAPEIL